ncbi:MAG: hypothetical protein KCHDKBKB_01653 [Elusimicrobia bacterium]|nr:hypothetical protein [Elusimicrobiota bacterium]
MAHETMTQMSNEVRQCIQNCLDCFRICEETAAHCLAIGGKHAEASHIQVLQDCADICKTSAGFMARNSDRHGQTCGVCAKVCQECAESWEQMAGGDSLMKQCADACRRCAQSCQSMARM